MINFNCPVCNQLIQVPPDCAGRKGKCTGCGNPLVVPSADSGAAAAMPRPIARPVPPAPQPQTPPASDFDFPIEGLVPATYTPQPQYQQPMYAPPQAAVQVNIQTSHASNSLGIASLVLGILSYFVCFIPPVTLLLASLGLLLGIGGIVMSVRRQGTGIGYSIAGVAVNGIPVLVVLVMFAMFGTMAVGVGSALQQIEAERNKPKTQATPANPSGATTPEEAGAAKPSAGAATVWHGADEPLALGDVTLRITDVRIGKVPLTRTFGTQDSESAEELLTIRVEITNTSTGKKLDYLGWMASFASASGITAKLTDENENDYRMSYFPASTSVKGAKTSESIYPGKTHEDAIVFERPVDSAQRLMLTLSGKGLGQDGEFRFEIPRSRIQQ
jgi:hypothetical protein